MRRLIGLLLPVVLVVAACGDDGGDGAASTTTTTASPDAEAAAGDGGEAATEDQPTTTEAPATTVATDAPAAHGPEDAGEGEGLGDALLVADLTPDGEVPGPGAAGAAGRFEGELVDGVLCFDADVRGVDGPVTGAHVHDGAAGTTGGVVVDLGQPSDGGTTDARWRDACTEVPDDVIERLAAAPEAHYVEAHYVNAGQPDGAMRGQLAVVSIFDRTLD